MPSKVIAFLVCFTLSVCCMMMNTTGEHDVFDIGAAVLLFVAIGLFLTEVGEG